MDEKGFHVSGLAVLDATMKSATDILSSGARSERDRLLLIAMSAIALSAAVKLPDKFKLPLLDIELSSTRWMLAGVVATLAYYLCSFVLLTSSDWLRWKAVFGRSAHEVDEETKVTTENVSEFAERQLSAGYEKLAALSAYFDERSDIKDRIAELESRSDDERISFHERQDLTAAIEAENAALTKPGWLYDMRATAEASQEGLTAIRSNNVFLERAERRLKLLERLGQGHLAISVLVPVALGLTGLILLIVQIATAR